MKPSHNTIIDLIFDRAKEAPEKDVYVFLKNGEDEKEHLTYSELQWKCQQLAARIKQEQGYMPGCRALLLYQPGLDYIVAFFGCILAGVIPIPAYPPNTRSTSRLQHILVNAHPQFILAEAVVFTKFRAAVGNGAFSGLASDIIQSITWLKHENDDGSLSTHPYNRNIPEPTQTAFLQYTSGSTGTPKGVEVSHYNLLHNAALTKDALKLNRNCVMVSWLPPYHDMGLIGGIFLSLYSGMTSVQMSPMSFLKKPLRWLKAISDTRVASTGYVCSGAPNFAYEYCVNRIRREELLQLDLSHWKVSYSGSEIIKPSTVKNFTEKFAEAHFSPTAFCLGYGLAEATLVVTCNTPFKLPQTNFFDLDCLKNKKAVLTEPGGSNSIEIAACGLISGVNEVYGNQKLVIIDPETKTPLGTETIGEVCVCGDSVTKGYFNNPQLSGECYCGEIDGYEGDIYLRTGDLGFIHDNRLFIQGRIKDLIIIRGRNYYPHDIEAAIHGINVNKTSNSVAFSILNNSQEELVIVQEVQRNVNNEETLTERISEIYNTITHDFSLKPFDIVLLRTSSIPKTTSGKIKRSRLKELYTDNELEPLISMKDRKALLCA